MVEEVEKRETVSGEASASRSERLLAARVRGVAIVVAFAVLGVVAGRLARPARFERAYAVARGGEGEIHLLVTRSEVDGGFQEYDVRAIFAREPIDVDFEGAVVRFRDGARPALSLPDRRGVWLLAPAGPPEHRAARLATETCKEFFQSFRAAPAADPPPAIQLELLRRQFERSDPTLGEFWAR